MIRNCVVLICIITAVSSAQISKVNFGNYYGDITEMSVFGNNVYVNDTYGFSQLSKNGALTFSYLYQPATLSERRRVQRLDSNHYLLLTYGDTTIKLKRSIDGGLTWKTELDTTKTMLAGYILHSFFNGSEGIITRFANFMKTSDSCLTWVQGVPNSNTNTPEIRLIRTNRDSLVCLGVGNISNGGFYFSKDRGITWPYSFTFSTSTLQWGNVPADFLFVNKDSILGLSENGGLAKTTNGGATWSYCRVPITNTRGIFRKNSNEIYVTGSDTLGWGVVMKTLDFGQTWWRYNIGLGSTIYNMALLSDSVALLSGTRGTLLKWKYLESIFVGIDKIENDKITAIIYPNPVTTDLFLEFKQSEVSKLNLHISNALGQVILSKSNLNNKEQISLSYLPNGIYFLQLRNNSYSRTLKIIKQ